VLDYRYLHASMRARIDAYNRSNSSDEVPKILYIVLCFVRPHENRSNPWLRNGWQCGHIMDNKLYLAQKSRAVPSLEKADIGFVTDLFVINFNSRSENRSNGSFLRSLMSAFFGGSGRSKAKKESSNVVAKKRSRGAKVVRKKASKSHATALTSARP
jgi:hypothetical protein